MGTSSPKTKTRIKASKSLAVVVVDMQQPFTKHLKESALDALVAAQKTLLSRCAEHDILTVVLEYVGEGKTINELQPALHKVPRVRTIIKVMDDGFPNTELRQILTSHKIKRLLLTGINASFCVKKTAASAVRHGYAIITADELISDCIGDSHTHLGKSRDWYQKNGRFHERIAIA